MNTRFSLLGTTAAGAAVMYLLDPALGRRRRAYVRDKLTRAAHRTGEAFGPTTADIRNRGQGAIAQTAGRFRRHDSSDDKLLARVRSELGRVVSHPRAIEVEVRDGCVTLGGPVLASEEGALLRTVCRVPGVREVDTRLEAHEETEGVPSLQGGTARAPRMDIMQTNWSPTTRLFAGIAGGLLGFAGAERRDLRGLALSTLGFGLVARAVTNLETRRLIGVASGYRAVDVQKTINIDAPLEQVFGLWTSYSTFPYFMSYVREVTDLGQGYSHWRVTGPAGTEVEWDAVITEYVPNEVIGWKTEPDAAVKHAGVVRFQRDDGGTRVHVRLSYNPPAGAAGHALARLMGVDPKAQMDADLMRMKSFIESGNPPHDAAQQAAGSNQSLEGGSPWS